MDGDFLLGLHPGGRVKLKSWDIKSYAEVAQLTGLPVGTIKSRLHQGRAKLQQMLAEFL